MDKFKFRVHYTNVTGQGASHLVASLVKAFQGKYNYQIDEIFIPDRGLLANNNSTKSHIKTTTYRRYLPNAISRFLECTLFGYKFSGNTPILVLGDIPIRCNATQVLFVQNVLLTDDGIANSIFQRIKYKLIKLVFSFNLKYVSSIIVQSEVMKINILNSYLFPKDCIHVLTQPVPEWLLPYRNYRSGRVSINRLLSLFYPATNYPHKNHNLLAFIKNNSPCSELISRLELTIPERSNPNPSLHFISCVDELNHIEVTDKYKKIDCLLFLSLTESLGMPLIEAMWIGLPIICPDLPYSRYLCKENAIYYKSNDADSLIQAICELHSKLNAGWWPDWSIDIQVFPKTWVEYSGSIITIMNSHYDKCIDIE
jgi:glycosyltransferase involved in cell wall biosynthesis